MGPLMPLNVEAGIDQETLNWLIRAGIFTAFGGFAGSLFMAIGRYLAVMRLQAYQDPITGLPNRGKLLETLSAPPAFRGVTTPGKRHCVSSAAYIVAVKLEQYDEVVSTLGHEHADRLLQSVAKRLQSTLSPRAGRFDFRGLFDLREGSFAVLIGGTSTDDAAELAVQLSRGLESPFMIQDIPLVVEARFGIARFPADGDRPVKAVRAAMAALGDAGRRQKFLAVYDSSRDVRQRKSMSMLAELRNALSTDDQLRLHMQPKVDLRNRRCTGVEALIRWHHPEQGMVPPDVFIPLVEKTGLMEALTNWVVHAALKQSAWWRSQGNDLPIAINISVHDLERPGFAEWLHGLLLAYKVPPGGLEVEVTESAVMSDPEIAMNALSELRAIGVSVALDDFGTGHSSLAYLQYLPVDVVKLDRSLISNLSNSKAARTLVSGIIWISDGFGYKMVAEGIENEEIAQRLAALDCAMGQGYYFAKPMPADAVPDWLRDVEQGRVPPMVAVETVAPLDDRSRRGHSSLHKSVPTSR